MDKNKKTLSVIIPIYNEGPIIQELFTRLVHSVNQVTDNYEFIFINDGSQDSSLTELLRIAEQNRKVFYINFSRNFGHQIAVTAGLDKCRGEAVVIIDGDLQDPPELIPEMYKKYQEGYEVVYARRIQRKGESIFKKMTAKFFYRILNRITNIDIPIDTGDFRLIDEKVVFYLKQMTEKNKFLRGQIAWIGFKQTEVLFSRDKRAYGKSNYSISKMIQFAIDGITGFSDTPLKVVSRLGLAISCISFVIILYALYAHFILEQTISGWTSLLISTMLIGGVQLISIGVIGEYISRMNRNLLNRPLYIIDKTNFESGHSQQHEIGEN